MVTRQRLLDQLNGGLHRKLALISAPAGFGKTTLITTWGKQIERPLAWLSLDSEDSDPMRFITYFIAALQVVHPELGKQFGDLKQSPQPPPLKLLLTALLNELAAQPQPFLFVLDDYHLIDTAEIHEAISFLLDHLPAHMQLVLTTREDPPLPLARLRVRGQLTELRASDLRFTPQEAADFLNQIMGFTLTEQEIAALEQRTEGWVAGLQMAALAMQGRPDPAAFVNAFTGSHRFVLDYLVEEVLDGQPEPIRRFLLQTAILNQLTASLCDAVTGRDDSAEILARLERDNLFVVPLDDHRQWYRYHHLFADVLQTYLRKEPSEQISVLHQRASDWYNQQDTAVDAIRHALLGQDFGRAADLIEMTWPPLFNGIQPARWLNWINALPDEMVQTRPVLSAGLAWILLDIGEPEAAEVRLRQVEQWLNPDATAPTADMVVTNEPAFQSLPATTASARAYWALSLGDIPSAVQHAERALALFPKGDHYQRGIAAQFLGLAYWTGGELAKAYEAMADSVANVRLAGNVYFQVVGTFFQAYIRVAQGRLRSALVLYEALLQLVVAQQALLLRGAVDLYIGVGELYCEWGELDTAVDYLLLGQKQSEQAVLPGGLSRWHVAMARVKMAAGDWHAAHNHLNQVNTLYKRDPFPTVRLAEAMQAQIWLAQGQLTPA
ncbi:MAG: AAA family ATPase, partial [Anaerolineales bacterium]|nr:AAA family ATPase [Anaerolineales bacterium]